MIVDYDDDADAASIWFVDGDARQVERTEPVDVALEDAAIVLMWDANGRLMGFEVLGASKVMPPSALEPADS